jgi:hypothetical protein
MLSSLSVSVVYFTGGLHSAAENFFLFRALILKIFVILPLMFRKAQGGRRKDAYPHRCTCRQHQASSAWPV